MKNPATGEMIIGMTTLYNSPFPAHQCAPTAGAWDQTKAPQTPWEEASVAPHKPPTRAWLELDGSPTYQVSRFQTIAPSSAAMRVYCETNLASTNPEAMVCATLLPIIAPARFVTVARK